MRFSFDFPEPAVVFGPHRFSFLIFTEENTYAMDRSLMRAARADTDLANELAMACGRFGADSLDGHRATQLRAMLGEIADGDRVVLSSEGNVLTFNGKAPQTAEIAQFDAPVGKRKLH